MPRAPSPHPSETSCNPSDRSDPWRAPPTAGGGQTLDLLVGDFARFINSEVALLYGQEGTGQRPEMISSWGWGPAHEQISRSLDGGFVGRALRSGRRAALEPLDPLVDSGLIHAKSPPLTAGLATPVRVATEICGHLLAGFATAPQDRNLTLWRAESYAAVVALCIHDPTALDGLLGAARHDGLTGCFTYETMLRELDREIKRSARGGLPLSICFIDLDGFKRVNDEYGHLRGNEVLAHVGAALRAAVRGSDTVGRYGGDEFIAVLPQSSEREARRLAGRLRSRLADAPIRWLHQPITASIGVAEWTPGTGTAELLASADAALLAAKARGTGVLTARAMNSTEASTRWGRPRSHHSRARS